MLQVRSLNVYYGLRRVLQDVNFSLEAGSVLALIGPNGAGKSTLIRALSGVLPIRSGQALINDQPIARLSPQQRARWLAVVPQARNLPPAFTAWETVALGRTPHLNWLGQLSDKDKEVVSSAMQRTTTWELAQRPVGELSGGEQQRLLLARALAQSAPILLLDEPTAHLDLQYQASLLGLIRDLAHHDKLAVLLVLHDLNMVARYADQVALMVSGGIQSLGTPGDVLTVQHLSQAYHTPIQIIPAGAGIPPVIMPGL